MLGIIKGKLQTVQNDISEGIRQLKKKRPLSQRGLPSNVSFHLEFIDPNAGAEILHNYNESWHRIHTSTSESAERAQRVNADLQTLRAVVDRKSTDFIHLQTELRRLNNVSDELSNLITETAKLEGLCEEVESALAYLDVLCHTEDMQNIKLEQRFQLALYRESKMADLNETKTQLAMEFMQENERLDKRRQRQHQDKLKLLQEAAERDLDTFRNTGVITNSLLYADEAKTPSRPSLRNGNGAGTDLSSYVPELGLEDQHELEDFLSDVKLEDSGIVGDNGSGIDPEQDSNANDK